MRTTARQTRENCTITVDFQNEATYFHLLDDGKAFVELVLAFVLSLGFQLKHKTTCSGGGCLTRHSHYGLNIAAVSYGATDGLKRAQEAILVLLRNGLYRKGCLRPAKRPLCSPHAY